MNINSQTSIEELIEICPKAIEIFQKYNINVFLCSEPVWDTISGICEKSNVDINLILSEINEICGNENT